MVVGEAGKPKISNIVEQWLNFGRRDKFQAKRLKRLEAAQVRNKKAKELRKVERQYANECLTSCIVTQVLLPRARAEAARAREHVATSEDEES